MDERKLEIEIDKLKPGWLGSAVCVSGKANSANAVSQSPLEPGIRAESSDSTSEGGQKADSSRFSIDVCRWSCWGGLLADIANIDFFEVEYFMKSNSVVE